MLLAAALLPAGAMADADAAAGWQLSLRSDRHADALPLRQLGTDDWAASLAPRAGRNLAYVDDEIRLSVGPAALARRLGPGWTAALVVRSSATLVASHDALVLAGQVASGERPQADDRWQNDVRLRGFAGFGAELGREHPLSPQWTARWSAQALALTRWRERQLTGPAAYDAVDRSYRFALQSDELNDRLDAPFQQSFSPRGAGLLLGAELAWQGERGSAKLALRDGGWLHWSGVPQQHLQLDTETAGVDADGFLVYRPLVQGNNSQRGTTRRWPWRGRAELGWRVTDSGTLLASVDTVPDFGPLPALQWQQRSGALAWSVGWRLHERRATVSAGWHGWQLRAGIDRLGSASRSREFSLVYGWMR